MWWKSKTKPIFNETPQRVGFNWQREGDRLIAYPDALTGLWVKYTITPYCGGYSVDLNGYRYSARVGTYAKISDATKAAEQDYRKRNA